MSSFPLLRDTPSFLSLDEVARYLGVDPPGGEAGALRVERVTPLEGAVEGALALVADPRYLKAMAASRASAFLVASRLADDVAGSPEPGVRDRPRLVVADPHRALRRILLLLHPPLEEGRRPGDAEVHPTAVVEEGAELASGVRVGPFAVVEAGARVGEGSQVGAHVVVGAGAQIGAGCRLLPQCVVYPGTLLGDRVTLHAGARVGVDGFGYVFEEGEHRHIPHVGRCVLEDDVEIGANTCIDRGSIGETRISRGTKIDNLVHVGHNSRVGTRSLITAQVGLSGSASLGAGVVVGGQAGIAGHLQVGDGARIAAQAGVIGEVPPGETVMGFPARPQREFLKATAALYRLPELVRRVRGLEGRGRGGEGDV
jgi:UDP-3-O-[3-hydroxymyristoyl] glucosamine N-acyltransferase